MAKAVAIAAGRSGAATLTTQTISAAVCALTTLAFLLDAALWPRPRTLPGRGDDHHPLATRTVTSYLLGGLPMPGRSSSA
jgi:hypothetical protein